MSIRELAREGASGRAKKTHEPAPPVDDLDDDFPDEQDDTDPDETDDPEVDGDGGDEDDWSPPTREEWEAQRGKLKRAREQAKKLREKKTGTSTDDKTGADAAELERWQTRAIRGDAKAALLDRNADPTVVGLLLDKLKFSEVEFDEDDDPILDDWLDEMEEKYPKLFGGSASNGNGRAGQAPATARRRPGAGVDQGAAASTANSTVKPQRGLAQQLVDSAMGGRRRR